MNLPTVIQRPSPNYSPVDIRHDWLIAHLCEGGYAGSVAWLCLRDAGASAHLCMNEDGTEVSQLVPLGQKAWAECSYNGQGVSMEIPGFTTQGVPNERWRAAAAIFGWLCRAYEIPPLWATGGQTRGIVQHHDLGALGGGHVDCCPVGSPTWISFIGMVQAAYAEISNGPLPPFALHGLPNPHEVQLPPDVTPTPSHGGAPRIDPTETALLHKTSSSFPHGSVADLQWRLNEVGATLKVDGFAGPATRAALKQFQLAHKLDVDGLMGPKTYAALNAATT